MPTIGKRLRSAREQQLLTQIELSDQSGVPVVTISRIENDHYRRRPHFSTLRRLAQSLRVDATWLAHGGSDGTRMLSAALVLCGGGCFETLPL
jgi:transcriptional regulator with XRE-family HTH domain